MIPKEKLDEVVTIITHCDVCNTSEEKILFLRESLFKRMERYNRDAITAFTTHIDGVTEFEWGFVCSTCPGFHPVKVVGIWDNKEGRLL